MSDATCQPDDEIERALPRDPEALRQRLLQEIRERQHAQCQAHTQSYVAQLALDLLVNDPDIEAFFGHLAKAVVEESESRACGVWLLDKNAERCDLWMAFEGDRLYLPNGAGLETLDWPRVSMAEHLFTDAAGWTTTAKHPPGDERLPADVRTHMGTHAMAVCPLVLGERTLGWVSLLTEPEAGCDGGWLVGFIEAIARQGALALHQSRLAEQGRIEERRKAILEERNRLARDIHDNLAQGFAAILMQLQGAQREAVLFPGVVATSIDTAVDLARMHLAEARRSVGALRPNVGSDEDVATVLRRMVALGQRTSSVPIDLVLDELPRFGDGVEREILGIAREALSNAVRHSRAKRITVRASSVKSIGLRLSVADDGRGMAGDRSLSGFGMTSMQERAQRIGASLTIVTAPRRGTEVVLAWEPSSLPTQVHVAG